MNNCPECQPSTLTVHGEKKLRADIERLECEVSNLKLANEEARKTIDRLNELIPREANHGGPVLEGHQK